MTVDRAAPAHRACVTFGGYKFKPQDSKTVAHGNGKMEGERKI